MALRDLRNLLLTSHGDALIDDDELIVLYDLYSSKNPGFRVTFVFVWKLKVYSDLEQLCMAVTLNFGC